MAKYEQVIQSYRILLLRRVKMFYLFIYLLASSQLRMITFYPYRAVKEFETCFSR